MKVFGSVVGEVIVVYDYGWGFLMSGFTLMIWIGGMNSSKGIRGSKGMFWEVRFITAMFAMEHISN